METLPQKLAVDCTECNLCTKECGFLKKHGNPGTIAKRVIKQKDYDHLLPFECSLCGLCASVCPVNLEPAAMFGYLRKKKYSQSNSDFKKHSAIIAYEKRGCSTRYTLNKIPENCKSVFFPGCALSGTRAGRTEQIFNWLEKNIPNVGIILNCCTKPSLDLGRERFFHTNFSKLESTLLKAGVNEIITACPNCYYVFSTFSKQLKTISLYEILIKKGFSQKKTKLPVKLTIHDSCVTRFNIPIQESVRQLVINSGNLLFEMQHSKSTTFCCGEGGSASFIAPELSDLWIEKRKTEASGLRVLTYCAGCNEHLKKHMRTNHILDLIFEPEKTINGSIKASKPPFTYIRRINLKRRLKKRYNNEKR